MKGVPVLGAGPSVPVPPTAEDDWWERAACRGVSTRHFYSDGWGERASATALGWCGTCPVRRDCLAWALTTREPCGVWGGTTETRRRQLLRAAGSHVPTALALAERQWAGDDR